MTRAAALRWEQTPLPHLLFSLSLCALRARLTNNQFALDCWDDGRGRVSFGPQRSQ